MHGVKHLNAENSQCAGLTRPAISVLVPSYNPPREHLQRLYDSLITQRFGDFEVVIADDASTENPDYGLITDKRFRVLRREKNLGPAATRNEAVAAAQSDVLFFTDSDCALHPDTLARAHAALQLDAICVGDTITETTSAFGKAVALLGFPGGGILGFHKVWRVDENGRTRSFSSCNLGFRKALFLELGGFNEKFPVAGGEDTVLARLAADKGHTIRYVPEQIVYHVQRDTLREFLRWQILRGRGNYHIKGHVPEVGGYLRLRVWTYLNSMRAAGPLYAPWVTMLWVLSVAYQTIGFRQEAKKMRGHREEGK